MDGCIQGVLGKLLKSLTRRMILKDTLKFVEVYGCIEGMPSNLLKSLSGWMILKDTLKFIQVHKWTGASKGTLRLIKILVRTGTYMKLEW